MNKRQAIKEARECADSVIEQLERIARGWDKGRWRNDMREVERNPSNTIRALIRADVEHAFNVARQVYQVPMLVAADVRGAREANHRAVSYARRANAAAGEYSRHRLDDMTLAARETRDEFMAQARQRKAGQ